MKVSINFEVENLEELEKVNEASPLRRLVRSGSGLSLPVYSLSLPFSVLAGVIFLGERGDLLRKVMALILALGGSYILQAF